MLIVRSWPSDRELPATTLSIVAQADSHFVLITEEDSAQARYRPLAHLSALGSSISTRRKTMNTLTWLITGGFVKGYRTQVLGLSTALSALAMWVVGDMSLIELIEKAPVILGGLGLAALGVKVDSAKAANLVGTKAPKAK
jgi:hypothetical protein